MKSLPSLCTLEHGKDYKGSTHKSAQMAVKLISDTGYPLEVHDVITNDQYKLTVHRLPRPESRDAVFFQHGILGERIPNVSSLFHSLIIMWWQLTVATSTPMLIPIHAYTWSGG